MSSLIQKQTKWREFPLAFDCIPSPSCEENAAVISIELEGCLSIRSVHVFAERIDCPNSSDSGDLDIPQGYKIGTAHGDH